MKLFRTQQWLALSCFSALLLLSGCGGTESECDSLETRNSVIGIVADDSNNSLVNYAVKNSNSVAEAVSNSVSAKARSAKLARGEEIDDEWKKTDGRIKEIQDRYQATFRSWEEDKKKQGNPPTDAERNSMLGSLEQQNNDDISSLKKQLDALQEERAGLHSEYLKLNANAEAEKSLIWEKARQGAAYRLDETIRTNSRSARTRSVSCTGLLFVTIAETTAQKQVDFRVERTADGRMSVSVSPFLF